MSSQAISSQISNCQSGIANTKKEIEALEIKIAEQEKAENIYLQLFSDTYESNISHAFGTSPAPVYYIHA